MDRVAPHPKHTIHEITRNLTKQHQPMLILDVLSGSLSNRPATFGAKLTQAQLDRGALSAPDEGGRGIIIPPLLRELPAGCFQDCDV